MKYKILITDPISDKGKKKFNKKHFELLDRSNSKDTVEEIIDKIPISNTVPPEGLSIIKIDKSTGKRPGIETKNQIFEYYLEEHTPD